MPERRDIMKFPQGEVDYSIIDIANLILKSTSLTGVLIRVITRVAQSLVVQGVKEIVVTIEEIKTEVVVTMADGRRRRKLINLERIMLDHSNEIRKVENLPPGYLARDDLQVLWLKKIEELMYRELETI